MVDESKIIVLGSLSLRASIAARSTAATDDILRAISLRASISRKTNAASEDVLEHSSVAIAGFVHESGNWQDPKDMSYVIIHE